MLAWADRNQDPIDTLRERRSFDGDR